jgi:uncharacterized protein
MALHRRAYLLLLLSLPLVFGLASCARSDAPSFETDELVVVTAGGERHRFDIEIARTLEQQQRGLMFRTELARDYGMLFDFVLDRRASMWMQNTFVPLDMLFITEDGTIVQIEADNSPLSTRVISSDVPVRAVFEVLGGTAARLGIQPGDRVEHAIFTGG